MIKVTRSLLLKSIFSVTVMAVFILYITIDKPIDFVYFFIHFTIITLSLAHISKLPSFNLGASFSFFSLLFFGIIPLFEYKLQISYHDAILAKDTSYLIAAGIALTSSIFFYLGYSIEKGIPYHRSNLPNILCTPYRLQYVNKMHSQLIKFFTFIGVFFLTIYIANYYGYNFNNLLFRGYGENIESTAMGYSFITFYLRPLLFNLLFLVILIRVRRKLNPDTMTIILLILISIIISPIGIPRSLAGALFIPLLVLIFFPKLTSKYTFILIIVFSVLFVAPIVDVFRRIQYGSGDLFQHFNLNYFFSGHFDAFHNLVQVVELDYASGGWQVIGALLFWIPRSIWPDKPVGSNFEFAEFADFRATNISFTLTADLYIDYGILGVIIGMFLLGIIYKRIDNYLSTPQKPGSIAGFIFAIGHVELAILGIYLLRGNILSSFAYTVAVCFTLITLLIVSSAIRRFSTSHK